MFIFYDYIYKNIAHINNKCKYKVDLQYLRIAIHLSHIKLRTDRY